MSGRPLGAAALSKGPAVRAVRVDLVLSADMAKGTTLRIERGDLPVSLCAEQVKKVGAQRFEVKGRENLKDRGGVLPILFGARI